MAEDVLYDYEIPDNPEETLPFEVEPNLSIDQQQWTFAPQYYPDRFPQTKKNDLERNPNQCNGEDVGIKASKNEEFHITGVILANEVPTFKRLRDWTGRVDVYSPLNPTGGVECVVKEGEVDATPEGFDGFFREWRFEYTLDLVSTGYDEYGNNEKNAVVSAILDSGGTTASNPNSDPTQPFQ